jgi:hypothetical protein
MDFYGILHDVVLRCYLTLSNLTGPVAILRAKVSGPSSTNMPKGKR